MVRAASRALHCEIFRIAIECIQYCTEELRCQQTRGNLETATKSERIVQAPQLISTILRPFEVLTRSFLWRNGSGVDVKVAEASEDRRGEPRGDGTIAEQRSAAAEAPEQAATQSSREASPLQYCSTPQTATFRLIEPLIPFGRQVEFNL